MKNKQTNKQTKKKKKTNLDGDTGAVTAGQ
jgi:hypothetical protein